MSTPPSRLRKSLGGLHGSGAAQRAARPAPQRWASDTCVVSRRNSVAFRHDDGSSYASSSASSLSLSGRAGEVLRGMEVMDLRPSGHHAVAHLDSSSLVSLSSSRDSTLSSGNSNNSGSKESDFVGGKARVEGPRRGATGRHTHAHTDSDDAMPHHWRAAGSLFHKPETSPQDKEKDQAPAQDRRASLLRRSSLGSVAGGEFLLGESEQAYRALQRLMSVDGQGSQDQDNNASASFNSDGTGLWSQLGEALSPGHNRDSDESSGSSRLWDRMESNHSSSAARSLRTESSPLTLEKRRQLKRKMYVRRCATAMAVFLALAALSAAVIYLSAEDRRGFKWLPHDGWLVGHSGDGGDAAGKDHRKLAEGHSVQEGTLKAREEEQVHPRLRAHERRERKFAASHYGDYYFDEGGGRHGRSLQGADLVLAGSEGGYDFGYFEHLQGVEDGYPSDEDMTHGDRGERMVRALLEGFEREHASL